MEDDSNIIDRPGSVVDEKSMRQFPTELSERLAEMTQLTNEDSDYFKSKDSLILFKEIIKYLPEEYKFPEVGFIESEGVEFVWREYHLYGSLTDEILEFERVCEPVHEKHEFPNTRNVQELLGNLLWCLNNIKK
jgi:hypothetical protein